MTLDDFIKKYDGKFVEYHSYSANAKNQCVDLANQYIVEVLGLPAIIGTNAQQFPDKAGDNYTYILNTPTGVPQKGDLMIWSSADNVGHIGVFVSGDANKFNSFDQNYPTGTPCHIQSHTYLRPKVIGWLRAKVQSTQDFMQVEKQVFENLVSKATKFDGFVEAGYSDSSAVKLAIQTYEDRIKSLKNGFDEFLREMVTILDPNTVIEIADQDLVKNLGRQLVTDFSKVQTELSRKEKLWEKTERELEAENRELEKQLIELKKELEEVKRQHILEIERLQKRVDTVKTTNDEIQKKRAENKSLLKWVNRLKKFLLQGIKE